MYVYLLNWKWFWEINLKFQFNNIYYGILKLFILRVIKSVLSFASVGKELHNEGCYFIGFSKKTTHVDKYSIGVCLQNLSNKILFWFTLFYIGSLKNKWKPYFIFPCFYMDKIPLLLKYTDCTVITVFYFYTNLYGQ